MRRFWIGVLGAACVMAAGCPGCSDITKILNPTGVQSVAVLPASAQLIVGQTQQFAATIKPDSASDKGVTWSVAPGGNAMIDAKGLVTALAPGQAVVTATTVASPVHTAQAAVTIVSTSVK